MTRDSDSQLNEKILRRAYDFILNKEYDRALALVNAALAIDPQNAFALRCRGDVYLSQNKFNEALVDLNAALAINPKLATLPVFKGLKEAVEKSIAAHRLFSMARGEKRRGDNSERPTEECKHSCN